MELLDESSKYDILLIEDEFDINRLLTSYFESKGVTCKGVVRGEEGLEELEYHTPKLIITCVILPDYSGIDICKKIKSNQNLKHIPVFFCTAMEEEAVKSQLAYKKTQADGYIPKPFNFSDFDGILDLLKSSSVKHVEIQRTPLLEYKISEYFSLKLEGIFKLRTQIYVKDKRFLQCKQLVLSISNKDTPMYDEINSIDEAADIYLYQNIIVEGPLALHEDHDITPEEEFWGHCSNLQTWYENDYDMRLLHSNLAFNLLKALVDAGDPIARRVFKTEVAERFRSGDRNTIIAIVDARLLDYFSLEEKRELIRLKLPTVLKSVPKLLDCFSPEDQRDVIQKNFHDLLIYIELVSSDYRISPRVDRETLSYVYSIILKAIKGTSLMDDFKKKITSLSSPMLTLQFHNTIQELEKEENDLKSQKKTQEMKYEPSYSNFPSPYLSAPKPIQAPDLSLNPLKEEEKCSNCGKIFPPKALRILITKKVIYCPYCGTLNRRFSAEKEEF